MLVDVLRRLPDSNETVLNLEKQGKTGSGCQRGEALIREEVLPNLDKLTNDEDVDVRYFASIAAKGYGDAMQT